MIRAPRDPQRGFTLVELMTSLVLVGLLTALAFGITQDARAAARTTSQEVAELTELQHLLLDLESDLRADRLAVVCWTTDEGSGLQRTSGDTSRTYDLPVESLTFERDGSLQRATLTLAARRAGRPGTVIAVSATPRTSPQELPR